MDGKKKKRGGLLLAKPDYKKAYITLKSPLSISPDLFPIKIIQEEKRAMNKQSKTTIVEEGEKKSHWLDAKDRDRFKPEKSPPRRGNRSEETAKFPWSSMTAAAR